MSAPQDFATAVVSCPCDDGVPSVVRAAAGWTLADVREFCREEYALAVLTDADGAVCGRVDESGEVTP